MSFKDISGITPAPGAVIDTITLPQPTYLAYVCYCAAFLACCPFRMQFRYNVTSLVGSASSPSNHDIGISITSHLSITSGIDTISFSGQTTSRYVALNSIDIIRNTSDTNSCVGETFQAKVSVRGTTDLGSSNCDTGGSSPIQIT